LPVSLIAVDAPEVVHDALDSQLRSTLPGEHDGRFVRAVAGQTMEGIGPREEVLLERIGVTVHPLGDVLRSRVETGALKRLVERGLVQIAGVTPSDASHVLGLADTWDAIAAEKALALFGRRRTGSGDRLATEPKEMAKVVISQLEHQTSLALLETAFSEEETGFGLEPSVLARHVLMQRGLGGHQGLVRLDTGLSVPVIGLGASASTYYPAVGKRLGCEMILPEHAGVANAIGAVVGRVTMREAGTVTSPSEGKYRVHLIDGPEDFGDEKSALSRLEVVLRARALAAAETAGAVDIQIDVVRDIRTAGMEAREVFVEAEITVEASGRPRVAG
jgi:N-methylhydantoinase A/oxoprolinase/acetone carboxylase beta subunit